MEKPNTESPNGKVQDAPEEAVASPPTTGIVLTIQDYQNVMAMNPMAAAQLEGVVFKRLYLSALQVITNLSKVEQDGSLCTAPGLDQGIDPSRWRCPQREWSRSRIARVSGGWALNWPKKNRT